MDTNTICSGVMYKIKYSLVASSGGSGVMSGLSGEMDILEHQAGVYSPGCCVSQAWTERNYS